MLAFVHMDVVCEPISEVRLNSRGIVIGRNEFSQIQKHRVNYCFFVNLCFLLSILKTLEEITLSGTTASGDSAINSSDKG